MKLRKNYSLGNYSSYIVLLLLSTGSLLVLSSLGYNLVTLRYVDEIIPWPTGNWTTSTLLEQGIDPSKIKDLKSFINRFDKEIHSMLIVRNGYLVEEEYFGVDSRRDIPHWIYSVTKSITATLVGIAIDHGYLTGVNQTVIDFFPNRTFQNVDSNKQNITIEHLLTMTSGLEWEEWWASYDDPANDFRRIRSSSNDWIQYILDKPMVAAPGTLFNYNGGNCHLLSAIIQSVYNDTMEVFAEEYLFSPLNITDYYWGKDPQGITQGETYLSLTSRDMAKIGFLYLQNGTWEDTQIVSEEWVKRATEEFISVTHSAQYSYGYLWWLSKTPVQHIQAHGWHGQNLYIIPEKELIVVFTSDEPTFLLGYGYSLIQNYIIPATNFTKSASGTPSTSQTTSLIILEVVCLSLTFLRRKEKR
jgi:CubicO group peptidase (beta-lactamase class C family)